jgi:hypothetical protein
MRSQYRNANVKGTPSTMTRAAGRIDPRCTLVVVRAATMATRNNLHTLATLSVGAA